MGTNGKRPTIGHAAYAEVFGARWTPCRQPEAARLTRPRCVGGPEVDLVNNVPAVVPTLGVLELSGATVHGTAGWIATAEGMVLRDQTFFGPIFDQRVGAVSLAAPLAATLGGTTLSLLTDWANGNYGHFLLDSLPRLDLFERAGYSMDAIDNVLCSFPPGVDYLTRLGVPRDKIVWAVPDCAYMTETLLSPTFPGSRRTTQPWAAQFLRERLSDAPRGANRRLYIKRDGTRRLTNDDEIEGILLEYGFEVFEPGTSEPFSRSVFAAADVLVGPHGAGLSGVVFCKSGTKVLELIPTDHVHPYFYSAATAAGLDYRYMSGRSVAHRPSEDVGPSPYDFHVDPTEFRTALEDMLAE